MGHCLGAVILCLLLDGLTAFAETPSTRPVPPAGTVYPQERPALLDPARPAFVPKFARIDNVPVGHFAEREYARTYTSPGPYGFGWGYGGWGGGFPSWGNGPATAR